MHQTMLQSTNQVPPSPVPNNSSVVPSTTTANPMSQTPANDNNIWTQPMPSNPPTTQAHGIMFYKYYFYLNTNCN